MRATSLAEIQAMAAARGGVCLSTRYVSKRDKLQFRCANGHVFELGFPGFRNKGHWCKQCHRHTMADMQEMAIARGGKCLSTEYINSKTHLLWECADGPSVASCSEPCVQQQNLVPGMPLWKDAQKGCYEQSGWRGAARWQPVLSYALS